MRIIVFLNTKAYVRNYLTTNAFGRVKGHKLSYLLPEELESAAIDTGTIFAQDILTFKISGGEYFRKKAFSLNNQLEMLAKSSLNPNFLFRLRRELIPNIYASLTVPKWNQVNKGHSLVRFFPERFLKSPVVNNTLCIAKFARGIIRDLLGLIKYVALVVTLKLGFKPLLSSALVKYVPSDPSLLAILSLEKADLLVVPSSAVDANSYEVMRIIRRLGVGKVLLLVDNWDNLSSKSSMILAPDFLGVLGRQSVEFAESIHGIEPSRVCILGTPRFDVYRAYRHQTIGRSVTDRELVGVPYMLFVGCAVGFDELNALRALSMAVSSMSSSLPKDTSILYRPHPWGAREFYLRTLDEDPIENVIVDPQTAAGRAMVGADFQPALEYYPALFEGAILVVCPLSTMILEATIMRKQVIVLTHDDDVSLLSPNRMLKFYRHFEGIDTLENLQLVPDLSQLTLAIRRAVEAKDLVLIPDGVNFYVETRAPEYTERLAGLIDSIDFRLRSL